MHLRTLLKSSKSAQATPIPSRLRTLAVLAVPLFAAALIAGCGKKADAPAAGGAAGGAPPPAEVGVVTVAQRDVGLITELPGRLEASRVAQVRARAAGILQKRLFREGSDVRAGQALFAIDAAPYQATLQSAQASVARAESNLAQATAQADRFKPLVEANAISKQDYVNAVAAQRSAQAFQVFRTLHPIQHHPRQTKPLTQTEPLVADAQRAFEARANDLRDHRQPLPGRPDQRERHREHPGAVAQLDDLGPDWVRNPVPDTIRPRAMIGERLDPGPLGAQRHLPIGEHDTTALHGRHVRSPP